MGSYYIPSNKLKGETRILVIFTVKSLIFTAIGVIIGLIPFAILNAMNLKNIRICIYCIIWTYRIWNRNNKSTK